MKTLAFMSLEGKECPSRRLSYGGMKRGVNLISDALPFGGLWYSELNAIASAIGYARFRSRSHHAVIRVYDDAGNLIETHEHAGEFKEGLVFSSAALIAQCVNRRQSVALAVAAVMRHGLEHR
jgi:hypothetical protein